MNFLLMTFFLSFKLYAATSSPESGIYRCVKGNDDSICDQSIKVMRLPSGTVTGIRIYYEGYCSGQGPYVYGCNGEFCGDGIIKISFIDSTHYRWEHRNYNRFCEMERIELNK